MSNIHITDLEQIASQQGKPVWAVLDEIIEKEVNQTNQICNQTYQLKRTSPITGSLIMSLGTGISSGNYFTPVIRWR